MKRNINDYIGIGENVAIECKTEEEWQKILELGNEGDKRNYFELSANKCIDVNDITSYWSISSKKNIIEKGYTIYPASDFLEEENENTFQKGMFKKGDYIINLHGYPEQFPLNYCFKQREDLGIISPELDGVYSRTNTWAIINFNNPASWRYATSEEIAEYERLSKPFDVTTLNKKEKEWVPKKGDWVVIIKNYAGKIKVGETYQIYGHQNGDYWVLEHNKDKSYLAPKLNRDFRKALPHEIPLQKVKHEEYNNITKEAIDKQQNKFKINSFTINNPCGEIPLSILSSGGKYYMGTDTAFIPPIQIKNRNKLTQQPIQKRIKINIKQINQTIEIKHYVN
jgi:hypothetical protein